jgi:hypothetical protein
VRIFKNKWFSKFARDEDISDAKLCRAVKDAEKGLIDADYGGGVIKQRIARQNEGKSGGYRAIILFRRGDKSFFIYGFAKNERENITKEEERAFKDLARITLSLSYEELETLIKQGTYKPVEYHE